MNLAIVGYGKMGRLIDQLAPEYGFDVKLRLDVDNNAKFEGLTKENFRGIDAAVEYYHERFHTDGWREHAIYPGIETLIQRLLASGHQLAVVTSKPQRHAAPIIAHLPFGDAFLRLYGPSPNSAHSEKASMIAAALADFGARPEQTVMIGDTAHDMRMAINAEVRAQGVSWGFHTREEILESGAAHVAETFTELAGELEEFAARV